MLIYQKEVEELYRFFNTSDDGLSDHEVKEKRSQYGRNTITIKGDPLWRKIIEPFASIFMGVLIIAAIVSALRHEMLEAIIITIVITVSAVIYYVQKISTELVLKALSKQDKQNVQVQRGGSTVEVDVSELVPGDIVFLYEGQKVPADCRVISGENIRVDEALLTGEDRPVSKDNEVINLKKEIYEQTNTLFSGSFIVSGDVTALVAKTGNDTEFGQLADIAGSQNHSSPVQIKIDKLVSQIIIIVILLALVAFGLSLMRGIELGESISFVIALSVSAVPEGLPVAITVVLVLGMRRMAKRKALVRSMGAIESVGLVTTVATDKTGTLTKNQLTVQDTWSLGDKHDTSKLEESALLCINKSKTGMHDPLDGALYAFATEKEKNNSTLSYQNVSSMTFDNRYSMSGNVWKKGSKYLLVIKGSPEHILERSRLSTSEKKAANEALERLTSNGFRVIALASINLSEPIHSLESVPKKGLEFDGFLAVADILRSEAKSSVAAAASAGITVRMITGDHAQTAFHIGRKLGIAEKFEEVFDSREMTNMSDNQLKKIIDKKRVFARVIPENKYRILNLLKQKDITAMTGDGVNDVPALANAHVGVAMGSGSQIAKEAADMVLLNDNFKSIIEAIREGRIVFANIRRMLFYLLATSLGEVITMVGALIIGLPLPVAAVQILWINLVTDTLMVIPLGLEPGEKNTMKLPPRSPKAPLLDRFIIIRMVMIALAMAITALTVFIVFNAQQSIEYARTIAFNTLVVMQWANAINARSEYESFVTRFRVANFKFYGALVAGIIIQSLAIFGPLGGLLHVADVTLVDILASGALGASIVILVGESHKFFTRKNLKV